MLNEDEELKLAIIIDIIERSKEKSNFPRLNAYEIEWLAKKLKETNDELIQLKESAKKYSKEEDIQPIPDVYKNPKNEISDRFYPR